MRHAIVPMSELVASGRWDAGYHVLRANHRERAEQLAATIPPEVATQRLLALNPSALRALMPLSRRRNPTVSEAHDLARKEPHLALAIVESSLAAVRSGIVGRMEALQGQLDAVDALFEPEPAPPAP